jgi:hypothetical protein
MTLWTRCWKWLSSAFSTDPEITQVVACRTTYLDATQVVDCRPELKVRRAVATIDREPRRHKEKRVSMRYPCNREVLCRPPESTAEFFPGRARNLSTWGVGIVVPRHVAPDTTMVVAIASRSGELVHELAVRVVHARGMPICGWYLGCEFLEELELDEVKLLT